MSERYEVRLSGAGGQGLILAGIILAEAVGIFDGKNVTQTQSYGPEARGGASKSDVVISSEEIDYPKAEKLDLLLALTQESYETYRGNLKPGGLLIVDSERVKLDNDVGKDLRVFAGPMSKVAREQIGRELVTNIVALGVIAELTSIVTQESLEKAVLQKVPRGTEELNKKALTAGYTLAQKSSVSMS
jgi:2-oxoglutarate ferredoxin oxidoreductase subunit gamma